MGFLSNLFKKKDKTPKGVTGTNIEPIKMESKPKKEPKKESTSKENYILHDYKEVPMVKIKQTSGVCLEKIEKQTQSAGVCLKKKNIDETAQVVFIMDWSGSFHYEYRNGNMSKLTEKIMSLSLKLDDDGQLPIFGFGENCVKLPDANINNIEGYVDSYFVSNQAKMSRYINSCGTSYSEALKTFYNEYKNEEDNIFVVFLTDGMCGHYDMPTTIEVVNKIKQDIPNAYIKFIGFGDSSCFDFIKKLSKKNNNMSLKTLNDINSMDYEMLLDGYDRFLNK